MTMTNGSAPHAFAAPMAVSIGYDITIHTANVNYAGTDGDVWLRVNGTNGSTQYWKLDDSADNYVSDAQVRTKSEELGHQEFILTYKSFAPIGPSCLPGV